MKLKYQLRYFWFYHVKNGLLSDMWRYVTRPFRVAAMRRKNAKTDARKHKSLRALTPEEMAELIDFVEGRRTVKLDWVKK